MFYNFHNNIMTIRIAHRGFIYFKELNNCKDNSYNSISNAIINNFDMIEVDIQLTRQVIIKYLRI